MQASETSQATAAGCRGRARPRAPGSTRFVALQNQVVRVRPAAH